MIRFSVPTVPHRDSDAAPSSRRWRIVTLLAASFAALFSASPARADLIIVGGTAAITLLEGKANAISEFDSYFNAPTTRAQTLSLPAPGNEPFTETAANVTLIDPIRPYGVAPLNDAGGTSPGVPGGSRTRQATTLKIEDPGNVLGSWSTSNDAFAFVGNSALGEQIAFTSMQRWTGPFPGALLYGDFGLRYTGSKLVVTSNIDFLGAAYADIGTPTISVVGDTLTISGDLLIGGGLSLLDPSATPGTKFGSITVTATLSAVPEPSPLLLAAIGGLGSVLFLRRRPGSRPGI